MVGSEERKPAAQDSERARGCRSYDDDDDDVVGERERERERVRVRERKKKVG